MIYLSNKTIQCLCCNCGVRHQINAESLTKQTYAKERSLGDEIEHIWEYTGKCPTCDKHIHFDILAYEYPATAMNWKDFNAVNCSIGFKSIKFHGALGCDEFNGDPPTDDDE